MFRFRSGAVKEKFKLKKVNNSGFTLLEVLVAIIILVIISVPFFRAFAVSAQTNAHAKLVARTTTAAENLMEEFEGLPVDQLIEKYAYDDSGNLLKDDEGTELFKETAITGYDNQKKYEFKVIDNALMNADIPSDCYAYVTLDPNSYVNNNSLNVADYEPVSVKDSAIFTMGVDYDKDVYDYYVEKNKDAVNGGVTGISSFTDDNAAYAFFEKNLDREIRVDITNPGTPTEPLAKVKLTITYKAPLGYVPTQYRELVQTEAYLYDNSANKKPLNGVYIFFYPRFKTMSGGGVDKATIVNQQNIKCNVYLTALGEEGLQGDALNQYKLSKHFLIDVLEQHSTGKAETAITLRTNLLKRAYSSTTLRTPYSVADAANTEYGLGCTVRYNYTYAGSITDEATIKSFMKVGDIDGKALSTARINTRIYKLNVKIMQDAGTGNPADDVIYVDMDGTKVP